jgi:hypothetical protein
MNVQRSAKQFLGEAAYSGRGRWGQYFVGVHTRELRRLAELRHLRYFSVCAWDSPQNSLAVGLKADERLAPASNERENTKDNFESTRKGI